MTKTFLKKLNIDKFRALNNVDIEFGEYITVVCGKNGTSKSSILGIAAQIFSFEKDYQSNVSLADYKQVTGAPFKSQYSDHFRISDQFDLPGSMTVNIQLYDGYTRQDATGLLQLMKRKKAPRPVVRKNSTAGADDNASRNFTHPVIFLSLKRLYPIASRDYKVTNFKYLNDHKQQFIGLTNELLNRQSSSATSTAGTINSSVAHGDNYDQNSVSAGEDNAGQIILALMSFRQLKEEYSDYKGGLLLIDEADAGLFPTAQVNLLKILERECRDLNIQVIMTSHSPTLLEYAYQQSQQYRKRYKTVYLSNTFGNVQVMHDWSWAEISADINTRTVTVNQDDKLPKIHVYFEDKEAYDLFSVLLTRQPLKKFTDPLPEITLGCSNYLQLIEKKIAEFSEKSIVCLDSDARSLLEKKKAKTVVLLPGTLPPDQLIFEHLYNLPPDHRYWENEIRFTRDVFTRLASDVIREFAISGTIVNVTEVITNYTGVRKPREVFKKFYNDPEFQEFVAYPTKSYNPWNHWVSVNRGSCNDFLTNFMKAMQDIMLKGYAVDSDKISAVKVKLK